MIEVFNNGIKARKFFIMPEYDLKYPFNRPANIMAFVKDYENSNKLIYCRSDVDLKYEDSINLNIFDLFEIEKVKPED